MSGAQPGKRARVAAQLVHCYTAFGIVFALLATLELFRPEPDARWVFLWLLVATLIDATDGPLARAADVKNRAPQISGRTIDDIVDYITFTFVPLLLVWRMGWVPEPAAAWVAPALVASLLGFANTSAKEEELGFFRGFPSYWNIYAFYAGLLQEWPGQFFCGILLLLLAVLTVTPVRFIYPNLAPQPWRPWVLWGAYAWMVLLLLMLPIYYEVAPWVVWVSLVYPAFYVLASVILDIKVRRETGQG